MVAAEKILKAYGSGREDFVMNFTPVRRRSKYPQRIEKYNQNKGNNHKSDYIRRWYSQLLKQLRFSLMLTSLA